MYNLRYTRVVH